MSQSMLFYLVQTNFIDLSIVIFLYVFLITNRTMPKEINRTFLTTAVAINIVIIADSIDYYLAQGTELCMLRYITSATGYVLRSAPIMLLAIILKRQEKIRYKLLGTPIIINAVIAYSSICTKWMFYFDETNEFHRGPLGAIPFIVSGLYLGLLLYWSLNKYRLGYKKEGGIVVFMVFMAGVATMMESIFHFKFIINGIGGMFCVFYYLFLHTQTYARDALTQALNRHKFYMDCEVYKDMQTVIVSVDLNGLKVINDTKGHAEGDLAIVTVANILQNVFSRMGRLYRIGGDEFVIVCSKSEEEDVLVKLEQVEMELNKTPYEIAWGIAKCQPNMDFEKALSESDERMYRDKQEKKKRKAIMEV